MSSISISFSAIALSRPNTKRPNKPYHKKLPKNPNPQIIPKSNDKSPSSSSSSIAIEATSYTRLPPKDDFLSSSFIEAYREITISDATIPKIVEQKRERISESGSELDQLGFEGALKGFDYGAYEVPDDEEDDEDYDSYEEDSDFEEEGEMVNYGGDEFGENVVFEGTLDEGVEEEKEKGVPAVMRCFDRAKIYAKAGDGGNGVVAFRREKYVPFGGPSGGDGGRGGNVYVEVEGSMNSLLPFRNCIHFRAGRGGHGHGRNQHGAKGEDVVVKVAPGTVIREAREDGVEGEVLLELLHPGQKALLLPGGRGGRGNAAFKSGTNKVPRIAEIGEQGAEM